jgi:hypothetical protein
MAIPREIREMIYDYVIEDLPKIIDVSNDRLLAPVFQLAATHTVVGGSSRLPLVTFLPSIAYLNDAIYAEFVPTYLRKIYLHIGERPDLLYLENSFETLPTGKGWKKITNLTILNLATVARTPGRAKEVMDTILQATNLQGLVINRLQDFYLPPDWPASPDSRQEAMALQQNPAKAVDARYIMNEYQLDHLFTMPSLRRIIIKIEHGYFAHTPRSIAVLGDLKDLLMGVFKESSKGVRDVTCQEVDVRRLGMSVFILAVDRWHH